MESGCFTQGLLYTGTYLDRLISARLLFNPKLLSIKIYMHDIDVQSIVEKFQLGVVQGVGVDLTTLSHVSWHVKCYNFNVGALSQVVGKHAIISSPNRSKFSAVCSSLALLRLWELCHTE